MTPHDPPAATSLQSCCILSFMRELTAWNMNESKQQSSAEVLNITEIILNIFYLIEREGATTKRVRELARMGDQQTKRLVQLVAK